MLAMWILFPGIFQRDETCSRMFRLEVIAVVVFVLMLNPEGILFLIGSRWGLNLPRSLL